DRLALAASLEQRQQGAVVADRLVQRVFLARLVARAEQVCPRLVLVLGRAPVVCEKSEDLCIAPGVPLLEPLRRAAVQTCACRPQQGAVRGLLDQRVAEAVLRLRPAAALLDQPETLQLVQRVSGPAREHAPEQRER